MTTSEPLIRLANVTKVYPMGPRSYTALRGVDLDIGAGEFVALIGPSGSGKSTILNMITGIDKPTAGTVTVNGVRIDRLGENALARWRGQNIGIVFQFFQLLPTLTALENVILPMDLRGMHRGKRREQALEHLHLVGLEDHAGHLPSEMSGGEQQRVAIARALANDPPILIADEPTGNLDTGTGERIIDILTELHRRGKTVVMVTHEPYIALLAERVLQVQDGLVVERERP
ncbi:MAG: ABC transporter ATP-binding protein [Chloroflexi bacterium]|nr:ABC transporter ATP-binding protein [Chloroflexota bacterium]MBU1746379.1 ABC transporter ATP-binding protein [Chloroflexota bacterium]